MRQAAKRAIRLIPPALVLAGAAAAAGCQGEYMGQTEYRVPPPPSAQQDYEDRLSEIRRARNIPGGEGRSGGPK
jgi:hypothetical protein